MNILVLTPDYPDERRSVFPFVKQLVDEMARLGHSIQVIAPYSITHNKRFCKPKSEYPVESGKVIVYRPWYASFSNIKVGNNSLTEISKRHAYKKGLNALEEKPDVVYGHFWNSAYMGFDYAQSKNIPLFVATGESEIEFRKDNQEKKDFCSYLSGVICVSTKNQEESIQLGLCSKDKCKVIPNAIDNKIFRLLDKHKCRKQLGISKDSFIVAFVGWFSERKGSRRVARALSLVNEVKPVYSFFIGEGTEDPVCPNILYKGKVKHDDIPIYLNAADVFVLPTQHEGCCNAIIEAMACGLPIISSDLPFNYDVLNHHNSILINPNNVENIKTAIMSLVMDEKLKNELSKGALETSSHLSITDRAITIISFFNRSTAI